MKRKKRKNLIYPCLFLWIMGAVILLFLNQELMGGDSPDCTNKRMTLLTIGNSNGEGPGKWPGQLQKLLGPETLIINNSVSGRTIGFDNLGQSSLNTLKQIRFILESACREAEPRGGFDKILICLGTNDCKAVFDSRQHEVTSNYEKLIRIMLTYPYPSNVQPVVVIVSPPPYGKVASLTEKYKGAEQRVQNLVPKFRELADKLGCPYIDIYTPMVPVVDRLTVDGVHFTEQGYQVMAEHIKTALVNEHTDASSLQKEP